MIKALSLALLISCIVYFVLIWSAWLRGNKPGARSFAFLMLACVIYSLGYYFELHSSDLKELNSWLHVEYLGMAFIPTFWLHFCIRFTENKKLAKSKLIPALYIMSFINLVVTYTNHYHHLFHHPVDINFVYGLSIAVLKHGPWCWIYTAYISMAEITGSILLLIRWRQTSGYQRSQSGAMFLGSLIPWISLILYLTGNTPLNLDLSPFGLILTSLLYFWGVLRYRIFELVPVARSTVFEKMQDAVLVVDGENRIIDMNLEALRLFNKKPAQNGEHIEDYFERLPALVEQIGNMNTGDTELRIDIKDEFQWIHIRVSHLLNEEGETRGRIVIIRDISARKRDEARLEAINNELVLKVRELNYHNTHIRVLNEMISRLQLCERLNQSRDILTQYMPRVFPGISGGFYIKREDIELFDLVAQWDCFIPLQPVIGTQDCLALRQRASYLLKPGQKKPSCRHIKYNEEFAYLCVPILVQNQVIGLLHFYTPGTDIDEKRLAAERALSDSLVLALANIKLREMLVQQSIRDPLTRMFNRRFMEETLKQELARAERKNTPIAIIMVDIDHFKRFNDKYGHAVGDRVLQEVSKIIESSVRCDDVACRYGGEEFTLILPGASLEVAMRRAEDLRQRTKENSFAVDEETSEIITISLGVAVYPEHGPHPEALLKGADHALYRAKQAGRDRVALAESVDCSS